MAVLLEDKKADAEGAPPTPWDPDDLPEEFKPKFQVTSLARLADQMQSEAAKRNESFNSRTAVATERTAAATEKMADARPDMSTQNVNQMPAMDTLNWNPGQPVPIPAFQ
jgi:hypothetical protein